jgi:hypothetical protein
MNNKQLLEVLQFADDAIAIEPYEWTCNEASELHEKLRKIINELVYKDPQEDYNRPELKKEDLTMTDDEISFFNANDARTLVEMADHTKVKKILKFIKTDIIAQAKIGNQSVQVSIPENYVETIKNTLIDDGFKLHFKIRRTDGNGNIFSSYDISWE